MSTTIQFDGLRPQSVWKYFGPGKGRGQLHRVCALHADEIITSTAPFEPPPAGTDHSWRGCIADFAQQFQFIRPL